MTQRDLELSESVTATTKRKLSLSKTEDDPVSTKKAKADDSTELEDEATSDTDEEKDAKHDVDDTYFLWVLALRGLFEPGSEDDEPLVRLRSSIMDTYASISHLPESEREEAFEDHLDNIVSYGLESVEGACEVPAAKELIKDWESKDTGHWWFIVTMKPEEPEPGVPCLKVNECYAYREWWITDVNPAQPEEADAMDSLAELLADREMM
ncbi:unnamed protein product [Somion occarium]|uniref:Uncharacterized protein n=1 Tax=Somion occarium TaxID=3059160 RepID=A0ABP1E7V0_9APHY